MSFSSHKNAKYSIMAVAVGVLFLLFMANVLFSQISYIVTSINQSISNYNVSNITSSNQILNYKDPFLTKFTSTFLPVVYFFYLIDTTPSAFYSIVAVDIILMAFDVYWIEKSPE